MFCSYLQAPRLDFPAESDLLFLRLTDVDTVQSAENFADDVVSGVPVETEHDEMESYVW